MSSSSDEKLAKVYSHIDQNSETYIARLKEAVAIASVSSDKSKRGEVRQQGLWLKDWLQKLNVQVELKELGDQTLADGTVLPLPPVVAGQTKKDEKKKTVCVYGHYDVQPAKKSDGWDTEPFELVEKDGKLFGRGSTDDKGPVLGWLWLLESYSLLSLDLPVNLKLLFEGMEESGSVGMDDLIRREAQPGGFLSDVDYFCISDNYWLGPSKPCITYGLRGIAYFFLEIESSTKDLHSGVFGGCVPESMVDLVHLMSKLVDNKGHILVPGIYDQVDPVTEEERKTYDSIEFDLGLFQEESGCRGVLHNNKADALMHRWRFPTLSIHGVEGAFSDPGCKTVLPRKVIGKFSLRLVPSMTPEKVEELVRSYLEAEFAKLNSPNKLTVRLEHGARAWKSNIDHPNYVAGRKATQRVYKQDPDLTREGGSIPITLTFEESTGKVVLLLPMGSSDDGAHSQNEKINRRNYIEGIKLLASYVEEISQL